MDDNLEYQLLRLGTVLSLDYHQTPMAQLFKVITMFQSIVNFHLESFLFMLTLLSR